MFKNGEARITDFIDGYFAPGPPPVSPSGYFGGYLSALVGENSLPDPFSWVQNEK